MSPLAPAERASRAPPRQVVACSRRRIAPPAHGKARGAVPRRRLRQRPLPTPWSCGRGAGPPEAARPGEADRSAALPPAGAGPGPARGAAPRARLAAGPGPGASCGDRGEPPGRAPYCGTGRGRPLRHPSLAPGAPGAERAVLGAAVPRSGLPGALCPARGVEGRAERVPGPNAVLPGPTSRASGRARAACWAPGTGVRWRGRYAPATRRSRPRCPRKSPRGGSGSTWCRGGAGERYPEAESYFQGPPGAGGLWGTRGCCPRRGSARRWSRRGWTGSAPCGDRPSVPWGRLAPRRGCASPRATWGRAPALRLPASVGGPGAAPLLSPSLARGCSRSPRAG